MDSATSEPVAPARATVRPPEPFFASEIWILRLLRWTCAALFFGRAWQHLRWDPPYRALLWSQDTMEGPVAFFLGIDWTTYASSPVVAGAIAGGIKLLGVFHLACGVAALRCAPERRWTHVLLALGSVALTFLAYCAYRDKLHRFGEFIEYASQFSLPLLLALWTRGAVSRTTLIHALRVAVACTFVGHGLYAVGIYPVPGEWVTMTMAITGLSDATALEFLWIAGALDFVVAGALFLPPLVRPELAYAAAWGLLTALARVVAFVRWDNFAETASQWIWETLVRLPHAALPVALLWLLREREAVRRPLSRSPRNSPAMQDGPQGQLTQINPTT